MTNIECHRHKVSMDGAQRIMMDGVGFIFLDNVKVRMAKMNQAELGNF